MGEWRETDIGHIHSDWDFGCLLDIAQKEKKAIISGPFGSNISRKYFVDEGVPVIRGNNLSLNIGQRFIDNKYVYLTKEKAEDLNTWATVDDLVFTAAGTIGQVGIIANEQKYRAYIISNKQLRVTVDSSKMIPLFAYYWFASNFMQDWIASCDTGSTIPLINLSVLKSLPVPIPPLPEQKAIASFLSSLDDKIDLLHRQNKTLEAMAETLFRQRFIEEAQEDWEEKSLQEFLDFKEGPGIRNWQYTDSGIPFINIRLISNGEINVSRANFVSEEEGNGKYGHFHLQRKDMVVSTSGTLGKSAIIRDYHLPLLLNTSVIRFRPKDGINYSFMYEYLKSNEFYETLMTSASGSVQLNFGPIHLKQIVMTIPRSVLLERFRKRTDPIYEKIEFNYNQIRTLEKLRDTLLPKLMSGEVRVKI